MVFSIGIQLFSSLEQIGYLRNHEFELDSVWGCSDANLKPI